MPIELPTTLVLGVVSFIFAYMSTRYKGVALQFFFLFMSQFIMFIIVSVLLGDSTSMVIRAAWTALIFTNITTLAYFIIMFLKGSLLAMRPNTKLELGGLGEG